MSTYLEDSEIPKTVEPAKEEKVKEVKKAVAQEEEPKPTKAKPKKK